MFAACGFVARRILKLEKVVLVRAVVDVHLRLKLFRALQTFPPIARVLLRIMIASESITSMVPGAAILGVGEHDVCVLIVTDPLPTTFGSRELAGLGA